MSKVIKVPLSEAGMNQAIKEVRAYKAEIKRKVQLLIEAMVRFGEDYAINAVGHVDTGETVSSIHGYRSGGKGVIVAGGNAIWLEFGTGVRHNGPAGDSPHPKGKELGMTIGEYGDGKGANPGGWWYYDGNAIRHTFGVKANMFMFHTAQELIKAAPEMARAVFK